MFPEANGFVELGLVVILMGVDSVRCFCGLVRLRVVDQDATWTKRRGETFAPLLRLQRTFEGTRK